MSTKKLLRNTLLLIIVPRLELLVSIFTLPIFTLYLSANDYGLNGTISAYVTPMLALSLLGINVHLTNSFFTLKGHYRLAWSRLLTINIVGVMIFAPLVFLISVNILSGSEQNRFLLSFLICIPVLFSPITYIGQLYLTLNEKIPVLVTLNFLVFLLSQSALIYFIIGLELGYVSMILSAAISSTCLFCFYFWRVILINRIYPSLFIRWRWLKTTIWIAVPVMIHSLGYNLLTTSDRIIMNMFSIPMEDVGIYTLSYKFLMIISALLTTVYVALGPRLQKLYRSKQYLLFHTLHLSILHLWAVFLFLFSLISQELLALLINGETLQQAPFFASILLLSCILFPSYVYVSSCLFIEQKTVHILYLVLSPALINIGLNVLLIPIFGMPAAILTTILCSLLSGIIGFLIPSIRSQLRRIEAPFLRLCIIFVLAIILLVLSIAMNTFIPLTWRITLCITLAISLFYWGIKTIINIFAIVAKVQ